MTTTTGRVADESREVGGELGVVGVGRGAHGPLRGAGVQYTRTPSLVEVVRLEEPRVLVQPFRTDRDVGVGGVVRNSSPAGVGLWGPDSTPQGGTELSYLPWG